MNQVTAKRFNREGGLEKELISRLNHGSNPARIHVDTWLALFAPRSSPYRAPITNHFSPFTSRPGRNRHPSRASGRNAYSVGDRESAEPGD
jgi:hypothetical protein